ncbi:MAG: ABC transporter ATP-binding protein [Limnohabitans sp.]|jgi:branched-chain amino acid transport system ATP-binding protein|nr:ABC transporter ATP-binding protein [Limnohabitans sp.]
MLELQGLRAGYGSIEAVHGIDLRVPQGQITAIIGPNGAGKSSTMLAIVGQVRTMGGSVRFQGEDITGLGPAERTRRGIAIAPEGRRIFADLTVRENLIVGGYLHTPAEAAAREEEVLQLFPRLRERAQQRAGSLSGGEQQMLAIGRALMARPQLLLVDELSLGLMPKVVDDIFAALLQLKAAGLTVLLVEQNIQRVLADADQVAVLTAGRLAYFGPADQAAAQTDLAKLLLS